MGQGRKQPKEWTGAQKGYLPFWFLAAWLFVPFSLFAQSCQPVLDAIAAKKFAAYHELVASSLHGKEVTQNIVGIDADEMTPEEQHALSTLRAAGGEGRAASVDYLIGGEINMSLRGIQILKPPTNPIWGKSLNDSFARLKDYGIPVLISEDFKKEAADAAAATFAPSLTAKPGFGIALELPEKAKSSQLVKHELVHVADDTWDASRHYRQLPAIPASLSRALTKENGPSGLDRMRIKAATSLPTLYSEINAYGDGVRAIFTRKGFHEIFLEGNAKHELATWLDQVSGLLLHTSLAVPFSVLVNPLDPKTLIIVAQTAVGVAVLVVGCDKIAGHFQKPDLSAQLRPGQLVRVGKRSIEGLPRPYDSYPDFPDVIRALRPIPARTLLRVLERKQKADGSLEYKLQKMDSPRATYWLGSRLLAEDISIVPEK